MSDQSPTDSGSQAIRLEDLLAFNDEVGALIAFLKSLTGTDSINGRLGKPTSVPSGLKVD